ncbi:MAG: type II CAAX endopeptidase family protein [Chlamydiota bacterium]
MGEALLLSTASALPIITTLFFLLLLVASYYLYAAPTGKKIYVVPVSFQDVVWCFLVYFFLPWLLIPLLQAYAQSVQSGPATTNDLLLLASLINMAHLIVTLLFFVVFFYLWRKPLGKLIWKRSKNSYIRDIAKGVVTWPIAFFTMTLWSQLIEWSILYFSPNYPFQDQAPVLYLKRSQESPLLFLSACFLIIVLAPMVEESLFRGVVQNFFKKYFSTYFSVFLSSLIFAFFHYSSDQGLSNLSIISSLFVFALFLGFLYEKERSLLAPMVLHALFNAISVFYLIFFGEG